MLKVPDGVSSMEGGQAAVEAALQSVDLKAEAYQSRPDEWHAVWRDLAYQPVGYARSMLDYQHAYLRGAGWDVQDASLVLLNDNRPCGIWPLALARDPAGCVRLTSSGAAVAAPAFSAGLSPSIVKKVCSRAVAFLKAWGHAIGLDALDAEQGIDPGQVGVSAWHQQMMAAGSIPSLRHDLFVDLGRDFAEIRAGFRKSYRPLINVGLRNWQVSVLDQSNACESAWDEFKALHREVAGRSTRSDQTWGMQLAMIRAGEAFLVCLREPSDGRLVGAGFFQHTRDEGLYAVAAYDRALFDKPLGHVVQQVAMESMKGLGLKWYRLGERFYPQNPSAPTDKEISISAFKQGFASHVFCRYVFELPQTVTSLS